MPPIATHPPVIFYDGTCTLCRRTAARFAPTLRRHGFRFAALQGSLGRSLIHDGSEEMKVRTPDGRFLGGAAGVAYLANFIWWTKPLHWLWKLPTLRPVFRAIYRHIAARRHCSATRCTPANPRRRRPR